MVRTLAEKAITSNKTNSTYVVVEQPKDSYYAQKKMDIGVTGGDSKVFSEKRFQHIEAIHVIPTSRSMYYKARSLNLPHYMLTKSGLQGLMKFVEPSKIQIIVYDKSRPATDGPATDGPATDGPATDGPATDGRGAVQKRDNGVIESDPFLHVEHDPQPTPNYLRQCEGNKVTSILDPQFQCKLAKLVLAHGTSDPNRDNIRLDFGFTSDQSCNERNEDGITMPVLKKPPSSVTIQCQDLFQEAMAAFSCFALSSYKAGKEVEWTKLQERREQFAETMHEASIFEAYRFALVPVNDCFALHEDGKNCKSSTSKLLTQVCCYSAYVSIEKMEYRLSIIGYSRESITHHLDRKVLFVDIISDVCAFYKGRDNAERCVNDCPWDLSTFTKTRQGRTSFPDAWSVVTSTRMSSILPSRMSYRSYLILARVSRLINDVDFGLPLSLETIQFISGNLVNFAPRTTSKLNSGNWKGGRLQAPFYHS